MRRGEASLRIDLVNADLRCRIWVAVETGDDRNTINGIAFRKLTFKCAQRGQVREEADGACALHHGDRVAHALGRRPGHRGAGRIIPAGNMKR